MAPNQDQSATQRPQYVTDFHEKGIAVIPNFLTPEEIKQIKEESLRLIEQGAQRAVAVKSNQFNGDPNNSTTMWLKAQDETEEDADDYYMSSGDKIRYVWEKKAFDQDLNLVVPKEQSVSKIGYGLHYENKVFRKMTCNEKVAEVCQNVGFKDPRVVQSMMIFKQPNIGSEVKAHQDSTFLITEPVSKLMGFWFALDDVTLENGCLWYIPGSHLGQTQPPRFFMRNSDPAKGGKLIFDKPLPDYQQDAWVPAPCKAGSCVLIHGLVVHKSENNTSPMPRPSYTFHLIDQDGVEWSKKNWLQVNRPFVSVHDH